MKYHNLNGHGFIGYPKGRNVERALGPSCPCVLCISHSLGLHLLHQIWLKRERVARQKAYCFALLKLFSLTGTVSTSPNLAKARARRASNDCRATRSLFS